ncbi:uncharacterized protein LOC133312079 [Gastrolobium bilobum]|uniref:uncharacterized protein LOC133312079 n=1 Tax=Gastrolobium bilobum TaxID=150636 RepID=UPI002AB0486F|nr:uncharacterized protein LOC133312079 [Gastrolobium bilobum]
MQLHNLREIATDEADNLQRSKKKYKGEGQFSNDQTPARREESWMDDQSSFKEILMRHNGEWDIDEDSNAGEANKMLLDGVARSEQEEVDKTPEVSLENREDGKTNFVLSDQFKRKAWQPWKQSLIVKLLGKKLSIIFLRKRLENMWARDGSIFVTDIENDFYLVRFEKKSDMENVLSGGPWIIFDHYLAIRSWEPDFNVFQSPINKITAWVRLPGFPIKYVNTSLIKSVGTWIGNFIRLDAATTNLARGKFARICVEVDLTKPLKAEYLIEGRKKKSNMKAASYLLCMW